MRQQMKWVGCYGVLSVCLHGGSIIHMAAEADRSKRVCWKFVIYSWWSCLAYWIGHTLCTIEFLHLTLVKEFQVYTVLRNSFIHCIECFVGALRLVENKDWLDGFDKTLMDGSGWNHDGVQGVCLFIWGIFLSKLKIDQCPGSNIPTREHRLDILKVKI